MENFGLRHWFFYIGNLIRHCIPKPDQDPRERQTEDPCVSWAETLTWNLSHHAMFDKFCLVQDYLILLLLNIFTDKNLTVFCKSSTTGDSISGEKCTFSRGNIRRAPRGSYAFPEKVNAKLLSKFSWRKSYISPREIKIFPRGNKYAWAAEAIFPPQLLVVNFPYLTFPLHRVSTFLQEKHSSTTTGHKIYYYHNHNHHHLFIKDFRGHLERLCKKAKAAWKMTAREKKRMPAEANMYSTLWKNVENFSF